MSEHFSNVQNMQNILQEAQTGLWTIELDEGKAPRMYADGAMLELLGIDETVPPEACYQTWYNGIDGEYLTLVHQAVERITSNGRAEIQYPWKHPKWGEIFVRCGGARDRAYKQGVRLRGYHQNISDTYMLKQEYDTVIETLNDSYLGIFLCNLEDRAFKTIKLSEALQLHASNFSDYEDFLRCYGKEEVEPQYRDSIMELAETENIREKISQGKTVELFYRTLRDGCRRIKIIPTSGFCPQHPWVIAAFDKPDNEIEKRISDTTARMAVAQIYKLVISVNMQKCQYNCVHYSGNVLELEAYGDYHDFIRQMKKKMPLEDRQELEFIFDRENYGKNEYLEGNLRLYDREGQLHYYSYYSACIHENMEERILLTVRSIDDKREAQMREDVLSNLCQCYYSIYLFDLENEIEEAIWQEEFIHQSREFPKGDLSTYYNKFVDLHVFKEDQEKMREAGNPNFLRKTLLPERPVYDVDFRRIYPDKGLEWVRSRFSVAEMKDGQVTKVVFANMNIHEQKMKELEEEAHNRQAMLAAYETAKNANEAKSNFLAQMSHDIRTPMNAIIGMASIAATQINDREKVRDCLDKINVSSKHLLTLINEILDMSKIEKGKIELTEAYFSLKELMEGINVITRSEAVSKNQFIEFRFADLVHDGLLGDANRIRQVMINLINNAIKYTQPGGKISITVQEVSSLKSGSGCFVFTVEDNGIGMSKEFLDCIFVPFTRADDHHVQHLQGTGLGMSIAHGIVTAMQGNIQVESKPGQGSRFVVTINLKLASPNHLPVHKKKEISEAQQPIDINRLKGAKILLVEDNDLNMEIARTLLENAGCIVERAVNGSMAVTAFTKNEPETFAAILMDIQMPVMDGYTAAREIRNSSHPQAESIPIIALTANAFTEDIAKTLASGMNDHVSKPIDYHDLLKILDRNINQ